MEIENFSLFKRNIFISHDEKLVIGYPRVHPRNSANFASPNENTNKVDIWLEFYVCFVLLNRFNFKQNFIKGVRLFALRNNYALKTF